MQMLQQENQQLKQGTEVDVAKLRSQHDLKMQAIALDAEVDV